ncbi:MAG: hypothetical protein DCF22_13515 [Leptolyngbya sp.]|nr:MAG: hypothetical protein DCF22_13515 [Leptolyngbya sp.]
MSDFTPKLVSAQINNYKSLSSVNLSFRNLTILVGANSSGKSNCLESLSFLKFLVANGSAPPTNFLEMMHRVGAGEDIRLTVKIQDTKKQVEYCVSVATDSEDYTDESRISREILTVGKTKVIDLTNGIGEVRDENRKNTQVYRAKPDKLALTSAGNFGEKPVTASITEFIENWEFYDLDPDFIKEAFVAFKLEEDSKGDKPVLSLDTYGRRVQRMLRYWAKEQQDRFQKVNEDLFKCLNVKLKLVSYNDDYLLRVLEADGSEIPFSNLSDGTLRKLPIVHYCIHLKVLL